MYNRENIDPKHLGLHVHLGSVIMLKTQQIDGPFLAMQDLGSV